MPEVFVKLSNSVTIKWTTNHPQTSRVIYDIVSHDKLDNPPNYGYLHSTVEDPELVIEHIVVVNNLVPGAAFYFRPVLHGSEEVVGEEIVVVLPLRGGSRKSRYEEQLKFSQDYIKSQEELNWTPPLVPTRPIIVNKSLMTALKDSYGKEEGEKVYLHMRQDAKLPFNRGLRTAKEKGHAIKYVVKYNK